MRMRSSCLRAGAAETMGVGAAAGHVAVSAAVTAAGTVAAEAFGDNVEADAERRAPSAAASNPTPTASIAPQRCIHHGLVIRPPARPAETDTTHIGRGDPEYYTMADSPRRGPGLPARPASGLELQCLTCVDG
jgi:hypothetical protein